MATGVVMLIAMIMAMMALAILGLNREHNIRDIRYTLFHSMLDLVNINLYAFGQNKRAWDATLDYNYNSNGGRMACIQLKTMCVINAPEDIVLRYPTNATNGSLYYDEMHTGTGSIRDGFRLDGSVCDYVQAKVTDGCVLKVRVRWEPFCVSNCQVGPNRMIFDITYATPTLDQNNKSNVSFLPVRDHSLPGNGPMPIFNPYR